MWYFLCFGVIIYAFIATIYYGTKEEKNDERDYY